MNAYPPRSWLWRFAFGPKQHVFPAKLRRSAGRLSICLHLYLCGCSSTPEPSPNYHEYPYITTCGSNSVTVVDLRALRSFTTVHVRKSPTGIAVNSRKNESYVANTDS